MNIRASYHPYILNFKRPSGTSRGVLLEKETWFIKIIDGDKWGLGECGLLRGLSYDDVPNYEEKLSWVCQNIHLGIDVLWEHCKQFPSIQFGLEQAFRSLNSKHPLLLHPSLFTQGEGAIEINGLIWMGDKAFMKSQIQEKLSQQVSCIKIKVGALDFDTELSIIAALRSQAPSIEIRLDANGGFHPSEVENQLKALSKYRIHSIEQPVKPEHRDVLSHLCEHPIIDIALDESLIGMIDKNDKEKLLDAVHPQYIILKPSFIGGYKGTLEWIGLAEEKNIGWWITSALESNVGLNAIAQWVYTLNCKMPQGLGTGSLFTNNIDAPLVQKNGYLHYDPKNFWDYKKIEKLCI